MFLFYYIIKKWGAKNPFFCAVFAKKQRQVVVKIVSKNQAILINFLKSLKNTKTGIDHCVFLCYN